MNFKLAYLIPIIIAACNSAHSNEHEGEAKCKRAMLSEESFTGMSLSNKQLALTFDDGPGSRTLELSSYLSKQNIHAVFFINGHCFNIDNPCGNRKDADDILSHVISDGHMVANHTQDHYDLTSMDYFPAGVDGDNAIINELSGTDSIIAPYADNRFLFRAPYGYWNERDYNVLKSSAMNKYVGPIRWDIGGAMTNNFGADWDCWQNKNGFGVQTTAQCEARYLNEIHSVGRGIILMHDADFINSDIGNTVDMVKLLIPVLKSDGYTFVRLDEVPSVAKALSIPIPPPPPPPVVEDAGEDVNIKDASTDVVNAGITDASFDVDAQVQPDSSKPEPNRLVPPPTQSDCF